MEELIKRNWQNIKYQCQLWAFKFHIDAGTLHSEVLERIWTKQHNFRYEDGDQGFQKWTGFIIRNMCNDQIRRNKRKQACSIECALDVGVEQPDYTDVDLLAKIEEYLISRYGDEAGIVSLRMQGMKYDEIAEHFRIPMGTMRSRLHYIRVDLENEVQKIEQV